MTSPVTIKLNFRAEDFSPIYFQDNYHLVFKNPNTRNQALLAIAVGIIWIAVGIKLMAYGGPKGVFVIISFILAITTLRLKRRTDSIGRWKKDIDVFLKKLETPTDRSIVLTSESFIYQEEQEETLENWLDVQSAEITDDYISLNASSEYLFPRKSMTEQEFQQLSLFISKYVP